MAEFYYLNLDVPPEDPGRLAAQRETAETQTSQNNSRLPLPSPLPPTLAERLKNERRREEGILRPTGERRPPVPNSGTTGTSSPTGTTPGTPVTTPGRRETDEARGRSNIAQTFGKHAGRPDGPRPNPLDSYVNLTYGLSLHAIKGTRYNEIVEGAPYTTDSNGIGTVLIASGGRRADSFIRNKHFQNDMYFDSLKMTTVIGLNSRTRGSNVIEINFTIVEPFSVSFVERLLRVANDLDIKSWDQMFLMLQIDFFGNYDNGSMVNPLPNNTKYIPIKIIDIKIKVDTKGAEYRCTAIPASHTAMLESNASTPVIFEVLSSNLGEFFGSGGKSAENVYSSVNSNPEREAEGFTPTVSSKPSSVRIYSFVDAMNKHQKNLVTDKLQDQADVYKFVVPESIAKSRILHNSRINPAANLPTQINNSQTRTSSNPDIERELTRINAGTSLLDVANQMIRSSDYFTSQINEENDASIDKDKPIKAFKFLSEVKLGEWDNKRKKYQKTITYYIKEYTYYNTKFLKSKRSVPTTWVKEYYYMYTGKNQQIIDFSIDFNTMFITNVTAFSDKKDRNQINTADSTPSNGIASSLPEQIQINRPNAVVSQTSVHATGTANLSKEQVAAGDLYKSMMSSARGDMINVKLKISGDPELIKQDDIFISPDRIGTEVIVGNSINMDAGEVHAYLTFQTPDDLNTTSGFYDGLSQTTNSFSGIYKIMTVDNEFTKGQFTQTLDLIRLFDQETLGMGRRIDPTNIPESQGDLIAREQFAMANEAPLAESLARKQQPVAEQRAPSIREQGDAGVAEATATQTTNQTQTVPTPATGTLSSTPPTRGTSTAFRLLDPRNTQRLQENLRNVPVTPVTDLNLNDETVSPFSFGP